MKNMNPTHPFYRNISKYLFRLFIIFFTGQISVARPQKLVQDSLVLDLKSNFSDSILLPIKFDSIFDARQVANPRLVGIDEVNQYTFVPVDLLILTPKPLAEVIQAALPGATPAASQHLALGLNHFEVSTTKPLPFQNRHQIHASMTLFQSNPSDTLTPIGELIFDSGITKFFKKPKLKTGYETAFQVYLQDLTRTLQACANHFENSQNPLPYNYRPFRSNPPWLQLNTGTQVIWLPQGFLVDGHLFFTYPEVTRTFQKSITTLRYRKDEVFETIEFSLFSKFLNYRLNSKFLFQFRSQLFLGINRWKDLQTAKHKLYDAVLGDLSFSQNFLFHPVHARTLYFGIGLHQNVYYIYAKNFKFQPGFIFQIGMQL